MLTLREVVDGRGGRDVIPYPRRHISPLSGPLISVDGASFDLLRVDTSSLERGETAILILKGGEPQLNYFGQLAPLSV